MQTFDHRGSTLRYQRTGAGEPVVFLHNRGTSHAIWSEVIPGLAGFECFALDLLGFGASDKPERGYELETYVDTLGALLDAHGLSRVRLVGNCMGSAISLSFATRRPADVRALVLCNPLTEATFSAGQLGSMLALQRRAPSLTAAMSHVSLGAWLGSYALRFQVGRCGVERGVHERKDLCACYASDGQSRSLLKVLADLPNYAVLDRLEPHAHQGFPPICTIWGLDNRVLSARAGRTLNETLRPVRQE